MLEPWLPLPAQPSPVACGLSVTLLCLLLPRAWGVGPAKLTCYGGGDFLAGMSVSVHALKHPWGAVAV